MKVLEDVNRAQEPKTAIAKGHGIPKCTLSRILKDREKIEKAYNSGAFTPGRKRMRLADCEDLKKALFLWFKRARSSTLPVTGPILEKKARDIALQMGIEDFKFSDGWLSRFKKRDGLVFRTIAADTLKEVEEGTGDESEEEMDSDDHQSAPLTSEASQAVELLQRCFQKEGCLEHVCNLNKMNAYLVKQCHTKLKQATLHSFFGGCDP
ncbi:hypothetical protein HPB50_009736 [Hyalomma asiaticum]|uniref:Uncharacterized protein n=1 Tax=Hyalomma asiaticum TaxID=266040 RepID=A0ACB7THZ5_HYAAI|nr:hypothetical protein HPB50_009736 [Hyalomma asiaticum]